MATFGSPFRDIIVKGSADNVVFAGGGNDDVYGGGGDDELFGEGGRDWLLGERGDDTLDGGAGDDLLIGHGGDDRLDGGDGDDDLYGARGNDRLTGGAGEDWFFFDTALNEATNIDEITDFVHGVDEIQLDRDIFANLGLGTPGADRFHIGAAAADAQDRLIYDDATGALYYDPDGTGAQAQTQFATLDDSLALTRGDFFVY
jgi:Ca2+-binding RTX toxin-like protein